MNSLKPLIIFLVLLGGVFYLYAIIEAGIISIEGAGKFDEFLNSAAITIGGILSTNLGAVLGITLSPPKPPAGNFIFQQPKTFLKLRSSINDKNPKDDEPTPVQKMQIIACYFYVISLLTALVLWRVALVKNPDGDIVQLLPQLSWTLLGVIAGALTVFLGRK